MKAMIAGRDDGEGNHVTGDGVSGDDGEGNRVTVGMVVLVVMMVGIMTWGL